MPRAEDEESPALVPLTPFSLQPGSSEHSLVLLLTNSLCYHEFTVCAANLCLFAELSF